MGCTALANLEQHVFAAATELALPPHAAAGDRDARLGGRCLLLRRGMWTVTGALLAMHAISLCVAHAMRVTTAFGKRRPAILIVLLIWVTDKDNRHGSGG